MSQGNARYLVFQIVERMATHWRLFWRDEPHGLVIAGERVDGILVKRRPREEVQPP